MDCNQVFMILTRGPFPTGESWDEEVEAHLEVCTDCWRLAEALRPALEVFQEAIPPAESRDLPGYWGEARPASSVVSELSQLTSRVATAADVRRMTRPYQRQFADPATGNSASEVWRAVILASTVTATAIGLALVWWLA